MKIVEYPSGDWSCGLDASERKTVIQIAKDSLEWSLTGRKPPFNFEKYDLTPSLKAKAAVFVTFTNKGSLRGCIGTLVAHLPLYIAVHEYAVHASSDPRFFSDPITLSELSSINVRVSILSPMREISSLSEFEIGKHGIVLRKGSRQSVFLPEVAVEQGWDKEQTLSHLCRKAGLNPDAWKEGCSFSVFSSVVLTEEETGKKD